MEEGDGVSPEVMYLLFESISNVRAIAVMTRGLEERLAEAEEE
jgi:hypothetical protein